MELKINFDAEVGKIKPMHAVGQPPFQGLPGEYIHYLTEANIPYSRLHDVGGLYGGNMFVDIPNIFRDFSADENDPESYQFEFTDILIKELIKAKCKPIYRLGVTIENYSTVRALRLTPPADFGKWARICEHIIRHYNEGWKDGFRFGIEYFEIWNEPENMKDPALNPMWAGTQEQYFKLYEVTSKHLRKCFGNSIKIGGPASCGYYSILSNFEKYDTKSLKKFKNFTEKKETPEDKINSEYRTDFSLDFLDFINETGSPLDFFSWHSYGNVKETELYAEFIQRELDKRGFADVETHLNEWNNAIYNRGTSFASAQAAAMILAQQKMKTSMLCYYDARIGVSIYGGLFHPFTRKPFCTYYVFKAFGEMYALGTEVESHIDSEDVYVAAAKNADKKAVLIANIGENAVITSNLPENMKIYLIDENNFITETDRKTGEFEINKNETLFIK